MEDYGFVQWIVIGGIAGVIAKLLMPGKDPGGCIVTVLLGIAGAALTGWIAHQTNVLGPDWRSGFVGAVVGAFLILLVYRLIAARRR